MSKGDDALRALRAHLAGQNLPEGARLAPERELSARLAISRRALREALSRLELEGVLWRGIGQGTFLGPRPASEPARSLPVTPPPDIMEARLALEPQLAGLAAAKARAEDLTAIDQAVRRGAETTDPQSWGRWDMAFHRAVAQAAQNPLLLGLFDQLEACRARAAWGRLRATVTTEAVRRRSVAEHRRIAEAIAGRDPAAAHAAMWEHLQAVAQSVRDALRAGNAWAGTLPREAPQPLPPQAVARGQA
ncbi:FCD domain-containing protein [Roseomonas sp. GC11]|uniref:FadR/GntR family transcriptional regulator n=1 Tax=Roseomonas sp. GC11 TaxID=2950546 RepID=UPI00210B10B3|nr:FCD domain-containing protein [Roseomonas sp. GC11]MCQ4160072.1 FCD domain-containing protein [Roseomonas sp. GC11]